MLFKVIEHGTNRKLIYVYTYIHIVFVSMVWNFRSATLNVPLTDCDLAI